MPLTYAIGDVHGRRDLLEALLAAIRRDAANREHRIIFLGDIIDRGPESRQCLDLVIATLEAQPGSRLILGNHEEFLLAFLDAGTEDEQLLAANRWLHNGGSETLRSYGLNDTRPFGEVTRHLLDHFPAHVATLRNADWKIETDTHVFVHGGIDPYRPLAEQDPVTTRWIREKFLHFSGPLPKMVVHGHTVTQSALPECHAGRIAIDTGAVRTGHLTCAILDADAPPRFLATDDHGRTLQVGEVRALDFR